MADDDIRYRRAMEAMNFAVSRPCKRCASLAAENERLRRALDLAVEKALNTKRVIGFNVDQEPSP